MGSREPGGESEESALRRSMNEQEILDFLDSRPGWIVLSTLGSDGFPHSVPLGYFRDGTTIYSGCRDQTQKLRNIERDSRVALMLESGRAAGTVKGVMIQGEAVVHRTPGAVLELMRLAARLRGVAAADLPTAARPGAAYIEVRPLKWISWDHTQPEGPGNSV